MFNRHKWMSWERKCIDFQNIRKPICIFSAAKQVDALTIKRWECDPFLILPEKDLLESLWSLSPDSYPGRRRFAGSIINKHVCQQIPLWATLMHNWLCAKANSDLSSPTPTCCYFTLLSLSLASCFGCQPSQWIFKHEEYKLIKLHRQTIHFYYWYSDQ